MRKAILIFSIIISTLNAGGLFKEYKTQILNIKGNQAIIKDSKDIVIGSSGIVIHKFSSDTSSIIAKVDVISKSNGKATLRFSTYSALKQAALPLPGIAPEVGDNIVLNYLYDRALIVAPNYKVYNEITRHFKDITWVHPDVMGAYLAQEFKPNPNRKTFQKMCQQNVTSLIFFALNNEAVFVDCNNFKVVKKLKGGRVQSAQLPFYTRVKGINTSWLSFSSSKMDSYSNYYKRLINR
ncbi:MAG: hypothetical protein GXP61_02985 [Epsilonproteobacteria bacterium]|nr:hypothetical protein [Campylobacterota bacterium]